jgi:hypothetical protein
LYSGGPRFKSHLEDCSPSSFLWLSYVSRGKLQDGLLN